MKKIVSLSHSLETEPLSSLCFPLQLFLLLEQLEPSTMDKTDFSHEQRSKIYEINQIYSQHLTSTPRLTFMDSVFLSERGYREHLFPPLIPIDPPTLSRQLTKAKEANCCKLIVVMFNDKEAHCVGMINEQVMNYTNRIEIIRPTEQKTISDLLMDLVSQWAPEKSTSLQLCALIPIVLR